MPYTIATVDVWAGSVRDRPGAATEKLSALSDAGANLEFVIARRDKPGKGVIFCAPIKGASQTRAAKKVGLSKAQSLKSLRIEGPDKAGLGASVTGALAEAGINMRGISAAALGKRAVFYFAFDSPKDSSRARIAIKKVLRIK